MDKIKLQAMHLATVRQNIDATILPHLLDSDQLETAMTKTETGYIYEIRYKQPGTPFMADAVTLNVVYEKLISNFTWDKIRETVEGLAVQVGRLAAKLPDVKE